MHLSIHFQLLNFFRKQARSGKHQQETRNIPTDVVRSSISSPHPTHEKEEPASSKHSGDKQQHTSSKLEDFSHDIHGSITEQNGIEVYIEILSNWGHPNKIGLTEVQFFNLEGKRLWLGSNRVQLLGSLDSGNLWALVNGKTKTTKSRFMWMCPYSCGQRLELHFVVPVELSVASSISHLCPYGISKVKIWNYNGSLNELNAGVREIRMFFGGELVWTGLIRKGCGNQAFDYCTVIDMEKRRESLTESNETHVVRSQTVILESPVGVKPENETQKSIDSPLAQKSTSSLHNRAMEDHLPETTNNLVRQSVNETPFWLQKASQQSESQATSAKKTPIWLRDSLSGRHSMSQPQLTAVRLSEQEKRRGSLGYNYREDDPLGLGTPFPRSNSEIRLVDSIDQPYTERSASVRSGRRAHSRKQLLDEESKQKSFSDSQLFSDSKNHDTEKVDSIGPLPGPITSMDAALSLMQVDTQKAGHAHTRRYPHVSIGWHRFTKVSRMVCLLAT
jgi:hypothetical protein